MTKALADLDSLLAKRQSLLRRLYGRMLKRQTIQSPAPNCTPRLRRLRNWGSSVWMLLILVLVDRDDIFGNHRAQLVFQQPDRMQTTILV